MCCSLGYSGLVGQVLIHGNAVFILSLCVCVQVSKKLEDLRTRYAF